MNKGKRKPKKKATKVAKKKVQQESIALDYEQGIINRLSDCQIVVDELEGSHVWRVIYNDLHASKQLLDDNWQNIYEDKKLQETRILKMATMHVLELKSKYQEELQSLKSDLDKIRNKDKIVMKDYDPE